MWHLAAVAVASAVFLYSDPYFTYLVAMPAVVVLLVIAALRRRREPVLLAAALVVGVAASFALPAAGRRLGLVSHPTKVDLLATEDAGRGLRLLASSALDPFGAAVGKGGLSGVTAWCNLAVLVVLVALAVRCLVKVMARPGDAAPSDLLLPLAVLLPFPAYALSGAVLIPGTSRYLVLAPLALATIGVKAVQGGLARRLVVPLALVVTVAIAANLAEAVGRGVCVAGSAGCRDTPSVAANRGAAAFARDARAQGITKLYTGYWDANFTTYWSHGAVDGVPLVCTADGVAVWNWLVTDARIERSTARSHVLPASETLTGCKDQIEAQLGPPVERLLVHGRTVLAYDGDLTTRLRRVDP